MKAILAIMLLGVPMLAAAEYVGVNHHHQSAEPLYCCDGPQGWQV